MKPPKDIKRIKLIAKFDTSSIKYAVLVEACWLSLKDIKRLHAWLSEVIEYMERGEK